jgi:hypothetical protein
MYEYEQWGFRVADDADDADPAPDALKGEKFPESNRYNPATWGM